jgi:tetratricopeptide (TPR) repeat protein
LPTLYRIFEVLLLLAEGKLDLADEKLKYFESIYDKMSSEHRFYYYWKLGSLCGLRNNHRGALTHYTKALKIAGQNKEIFSEQSDNEERLYYNLAVCYTEIELPNRAILFLNKMNRASFKDKSSNYGLAVDITIAQNYYKAGLYDEAEKILKDCLMRASITDNKFYIGLSLQNLGIINRYLENWETAIQYFNQTLHIFEEDTRYHIWALYWKILCMIELGNLSEVERFLRDIKPSIKENDRYSIFLQTLKHITHLNRSITVYNTNAIDYIENVSVPWFIENSSKLEAVSCYKLLERHYREASRKMKSFETNKKIRTMYEEMFIN